jgi:TM2 domain-containing membrane protein YozV
MRFKLQCSGCGEPIVCDEAFFDQPMSCGDCGCPIQIAALKAERDEKLAMFKQQQRAEQQARQAIQRETQKRKQAAELELNRKAKAAQRAKRKAEKDVERKAQEARQRRQQQQLAKEQAPAPRVITGNYGNTCPFCAAEIKPEARKCKHCGEILDPALKRAMESQAPKVQLWNPGVAAVLSFFIPGAGQIYKGQVFIGLAWLLITAIGYVFMILPGIILHVSCIIGASTGDPYKR